MIEPAGRKELRNSLATNENDVVLVNENFLGVMANQRRSVILERQRRVDAFFCCVFRFVSSLSFYCCDPISHFLYSLFDFIQ